MKRTKRPGNKPKATRGRAERDAQRAQWAADALTRAQTGGSVLNDALVIAGFAARGLDPDDITPRENVLSFWAWKAKGRQVVKGEKGIKVPVFRPVDKENAKGETERITVRGSAAVFHISQTKPIGAPDPVAGSGLGAVELAESAMRELAKDRATPAAVSIAPVLEPAPVVAESPAPSVPDPVPAPTVPATGTPPKDWSLF